MPMAVVYAPFLPAVPGVDNPNVTQATIGSTICVANWTKTVRPPTSYTNRLKRQLMVSQHLPGKASDFELDHFLSIEDGGSPDSPDNLWMQPYAEPYGARTKDKVETRIHALICKGKITLDEGRNALRTDWVAAYRKYVGPLK